MAAIKVAELVRKLSLFSEVKVVLTQAAQHFVKKEDLSKDVPLHGEKSWV